MLTESPLNTCNQIVFCHTFNIYYGEMDQAEKCEYVYFCRRAKTYYGSEKDCTEREM